MSIRLAVASICFGVLASGCANDPLVFTSGNMIGIKIAVSPSETQPVKLSVGYDGVDAAIIPTSTDASRKQLLARSHSCITKDVEAKECVDFLSEPSEDD